MRAHPRVCGENFVVERSAVSLSGSSPRVRGKLLPARSLIPTPGLIPACAGKTWIPLGMVAGMEAHPRVCGENGTVDVEGAKLAGSSPRVRGKLVCVRLFRLRPGLIPACAGKTSSGAVSAARTRAHPRVCGENGGVNLQTIETDGSSPRVRGKRQPRRFLPLVLGLIPACAGKTVRARGSAPRGPAHPRVCGENRQLGPGNIVSPGSSPRVRGKPIPVRAGSHVGRLIPACAGKTRRHSLVGW